MLLSLIASARVNCASANDETDSFKSDAKKGKSTGVASKLKVFFLKLNRFEHEYLLL